MLREFPFCLEEKNKFSVSIRSPTVNFKLNLDEFASKSCKGKLSEVWNSFKITEEILPPLFEKIIVNANDFVNTWNGKLFIVYLPDKERYTNSNNKDDRYLKRSQVIELINNLDIPIIDIHKDFFMKQTDPLSFYAHRIYGHYNPKGYSEISKVIIKKINDTNNNKYN